MIFIKRKKQTKYGGLLWQEWQVVTYLVLTKGKYIIYVSKSSVSKMIGHSRSNINELEKYGFYVKVRQSDSLEGLEFKLEKEVE